jgi:hypothetical protein
MVILVGEIDPGGNAVSNFPVPQLHLHFDLGELLDGLRCGEPALPVPELVLCYKSQLLWWPDVGFDSSC